MFEQYLQLLDTEQYLQFLDTLKEKKFSQVVFLVRHKILTMLNKDKGCGFIKMSTDPTLCSPEVLEPALQGTDAVILFEDKLFYADQFYPGQKNHVVKPIMTAKTAIELDSTQKDHVAKPKIVVKTAADLDQLKAMFTDSYKLADSKELKLITMVTGRIRDKFSPEVRDYLASMKADGEPFNVKDFAPEPAQISQIKKIINALYHAELALQDAESFNLRDGKRKIADLKTFYYHTLHHIYQSCFLATHFDVDFNEIFKQELAVLAPIYSEFKIFAEGQSEETKGFLSQIDSQKLAHKTGVVAGIVVDQLNPLSGEVDYEYLASFSADLPNYLNKLSGYIEGLGLSSSVYDYEPNLDKKKIDELHENADQLLHALDKVRGSGLLLPLKTLHLIHIVRHTIMLSKSIYEQAGRLNGVSQSKAQAQLAELKYKLLPELLGLTDKIEEHAMLNPGVLSDPLMICVSRLYNSLVFYTNKFVDFSVKGQGLVTIEDSQFVELRLEQTYKRSAEEHSELLKLEEIKKAADHFFLLLNRPKNKGLRIIDLPAATKRQLIDHYKLIQSHTAQLNMPLNNAIIGGLTGTKGYFDSLSTPLSWLSRARDTDNIENVLKLQPILDTHLVKASNSHKFHIKLNNELISSISGRVEHLRLLPHTTSQDATDIAFPYSTSDDPYSVNELNTLGLGKAIAENKRIDEEFRPFTKAHSSRYEVYAKNAAFILRYGSVAMTDGRIRVFDDLTSSDARVLYQFYQIKCARLERALEAYKEFQQIVNEPSVPPLPNLKMKLRNLYSVFQPYVVCGLILNADVTFIKALDKAITIELATNDTNLVFSNRLIVRDVQIRALFAVEKVHLVERRNSFAGLMQRFMYSENQDRVLAPDDDQAANAHHVIKHREYSKAIAEFRASLYQFTSLFNGSVQAQLQKAEKGLPFPELEDINKKLAQNSQALSIKQVFNCLYHLEEMSKYLEALNDQTTESRYAWNVIKAGIHFHAANNLAQAFMATPYFSTVALDIWGKVQAGYASFMDVRDHYIPQAAENGVPEHSAVLSYTLNAMMVLPEHIKALRATGEHLTETSQAELHQHTEKLTTDIERILANSSSYFKLFLEVPTMYRLFRELKGKIAEFSITSHDVVMGNLKFINDELLTKMLLEADQWEDNLGLIPGTLTVTMKKICDAFYQGLVGPLGLPSQKHIELVASMSPIEQRLDAATKRIVQSRHEQKEKEEKRVILHRLFERITLYLKHETDDPGFVHLADLKADFVQTLPILNEVAPYFGTAVLIDSESVKKALDAMHPNGVVDQPMLKNIAALAAAGASYYQGLNATHQFTIDAAQGKQAHLVLLKAAQQDLKIKFTEEYTRASFKKQAAAIATTHVGLIHCRLEYSNKLAGYLQQAEGVIVGAAKNAEDIDKAVGQKLRAQARQFEQEHYKKYYHLGKIRVAIARLEQYLDQSNSAIQKHNSTFESDKTVAVKITLLNALQTYATNETLSVDERISNMKNFVQKSMFKENMYKYHVYNSLSFVCLKQCVFSLLELLRLYTPERKKCYNELRKSVGPQTESLGQLGARFGLFSASTTGQDYDLPLVESDFPQPVPQPVA